MELNSRQATSGSATQEFPIILWNLKIDYRFFVGTTYTAIKGSEFLD
jgi:hypothetical protein